MSTEQRDDLTLLEERIDQLLRTLQQLRAENRSLRTTQGQLIAERARLIDTNEVAKSKIEAMINRLKAMESKT
jgi:cell division protein ZapB